MSGIANPSLSRLMQASTQALYECTKSIHDSAKTSKSTKLSEGLGPSQTHLLLKLMETLVDTKNELTHEIDSERFVYIDPTIINEMEIAIEMAISTPLDAKVNQIYYSIFGYNSTLWQILKDVQKLLKTVEILKDTRSKRVAKVDKKNRERRKKHHEKDTISFKQEDKK